MVLGGLEYTSVSSGSLNDCNILGRKYIVANGANVTDIPVTGVTWFVFVIGGFSCRYQIAFSAMGNAIYVRSCNYPTTPTVWNSWYQVIHK